MKLDLKDRRILCELDRDASQSCRQIAKKARLSQDAVHYRIERLEREGVIRHYYAVLNTPQLGYLHFSTLLRFRSIDGKLRREFVAYCKERERVIWCVSCYGPWDFGVSFLARDIAEYSAFMAEVLSRFGDSIHERAMSLMLDSPTYTREYLIGAKEGKEFRYRKTEPAGIDATEHAILCAISQHAKADAICLAKRLRLTPDIVRYRLRRLRERGILQGVRASIDAEKLGYLYYKLLFELKDLTLARERALREHCRLHPSIVQFIKYLGTWEIQLELEVESEAKLYAILEEIRTRFSDIIKTYGILRLKEEKLDYYPFA